MANDFIDIQARQMGDQIKETRVTQNSEPQTSSKPEQTQVINQKAQGFASEIQRYLNKDLGTAYKSLVISDANKKNLKSETYFVSEMNNDFVSVEVHNGPSSQTKFEFKFDGPSLVKNGEDVSLEEFPNFHTLLCFGLKKANEGKADIYKERV